VRRTPLIRTVARCSEGFPDLPSVPSSCLQDIRHHPKSGRSTGSSSDRRPCRAPPLLDLPPSSSRPKPIAGPPGSAGRRREALRPSPLSGGSGPRARLLPTTVKLERTSAGYRTALNTATGRKLKRQRQTLKSAPYLPVETHTQRGSHDGVRELRKVSVTVSP